MRPYAAFGLRVRTRATTASSVCAVSKILCRALRARSRPAQLAPGKSRMRKERAPLRNPDARSRHESDRPGALQRRLCWRRTNFQADKQTRGKFHANLRVKAHLNALARRPTPLAP